MRSLAILLISAVLGLGSATKAQEPLTNRPATAPAATQPAGGAISLSQKRDLLLSGADAALRKGLLDLAKTYPQLNKTNTGPLAEQLSGHSKDGEIRLGIGLYPRGPGKSSGTDVEVTEKDRYSLLVLVVPIDSLGQASGQSKAGDAYPNLRLESVIDVSAGNPQLAEAMKKLVAESLAPIGKLDKKVGETNPSTQPATSPPASTQSATASARRAATQWRGEGGTPQPR